MSPHELRTVIELQRIDAAQRHPAANAATFVEDPNRLPGIGETPRNDGAGHAGSQNRDNLLRLHNAALSYATPLAARSET